MVAGRLLASWFPVAVLPQGVFRCDGAQDATGVSRGDHAGRDVFDDDAASTDDAALTDADSRHDLDAAPKPYLVADADGVCVLQPGQPPRDVKWVSCCI